MSNSSMKILHDTLVVILVLLLLFVFSNFFFKWNEGLNNKSYNQIVSLEKSGNEASEINGKKEEKNEYEWHAGTVNYFDSNKHRHTPLSRHTREREYTHPPHINNTLTPDKGIKPPCQYPGNQYVVENNYARFIVNVMPEYPVVLKVNGVASFYSADGQEMSCGGKFQSGMYVAANKYLPMGTVVCVTNTENNRSHPFVIADRGPFVDGNRLIDLSKSGAEILDFVEQGLADVSMTVIKTQKEREICLRQTA